MYTGQSYLSSATVYAIMKHNINRFNTSDYAIDNADDILLVNKKVLSRFNEK